MANGKADLRLAVRWVWHPKTKRLKRLAGPDGPLGLLALWSFAAEHRQGGVLEGMDAAAIEDAAGWEGKPGVLHRSLVACGWLEEDGVTLHDWPEEQPFIYGAARRSEAAKALNALRWNAKQNARTADTNKIASIAAAALGAARAGGAGMGPQNPTRRGLTRLGSLSATESATDSATEALSTVPPGSGHPQRSPQRSPPSPYPSPYPTEKKGTDSSGQSPEGGKGAEPEGGGYEHRTRPTPAADAY